MGNERGLKGAVAVSTKEHDGTKSWNRDPRSVEDNKHNFEKDEDQLSLP